MTLSRGNKLWEGSRFMMPEHVEVLRELERKKCEYHPQELDEQYLEQLNWDYALTQSFLYFFHIIK